MSLQDCREPPAFNVLRSYNRIGNGIAKHKMPKIGSRVNHPASRVGSFDVGASCSLGGTADDVEEAWKCPLRGITNCDCPLLTAQEAAAPP